LGTARQLAMIAAAREDWKGTLPLAGAVGHYLGGFPKDKTYMRDAAAPLLGQAQAKLGNFAEAERIIAPTSADCDPCLIARGRIAALEGDQSRAGTWFARAAGTAPSFPFAFYEWGQTLLQRGQPDAAIEKFAIANRKSPRFADPLEGWGEALTAKNQSHLALAKFAEADKYAPNWGRLHLKWGEALVYAGKADEAKKQFAIAAGLDLVATDKADLRDWAKRT
jgi:tetratricopeptide (TPR) repeat protein